MERKSGLGNEKETSVLLGHLKDLGYEAESRGEITHSAFLGFSLRSFLASYLSHEFSGVNHFYYSPLEEAEMMSMVFLPEGVSKEEFLEEERQAPSVISCLHVYPKAEKFASPLTHRDFLGALLALGIERERVGDILIEGKESYVYLLSDTLPYVKENLLSVGRVAVKCEEANPFSCPFAPSFEERGYPVASLRLDALIAEVYHLSREQAKELIQAGNVRTTYSPSPKAQYEPKEGEHVSIFGKGKFIYLGNEGTSRKGKPIAKIKIGVAKKN